MNLRNEIDRICSHDHFFLIATRPITVIQGIPFYRSTGVNSHNADTWLPFHGYGKRKNHDWLKKPINNIKKLLPGKLRKFLRENDIKSQMQISRLGNLQTMCISASINTGFWKIDKGILLRDYLLQNYEIYL